MCESDHTLLSSVEVKNARISTSTSQRGFLVGCLIKQRDSFNSVHESQNGYWVYVWYQNYLLSHQRSSEKLQSLNINCVSLPLCHMSFGF